MVVLRFGTPGLVCVCEGLTPLLCTSLSGNVVSPLAHLTLLRGTRGHTNCLNCCVFFTLLRLDAAFLHPHLPLVKVGSHSPGKGFTCACGFCAFFIFGVSTSMDTSHRISPPRSHPPGRRFGLSWPVSGFPIHPMYVPETNRKAV